MIKLSKREYQKYLIVKNTYDQMLVEYQDKPFHFKELVKRTNLCYPTTIKYFKIIENSDEIEIK